MVKSDRPAGGYGKISGDILEEKEGSESEKSTESQNTGSCERIRAEGSFCTEVRFCMEESSCFYMKKRFCMVEGEREVM